jgi:hypothetical protein
MINGNFTISNANTMKKTLLLLLFLAFSAHGFSQELKFNNHTHVEVNHKHHLNPGDTVTINYYLINTGSKTTDSNTRVVTHIQVGPNLKDTSSDHPGFLLNHHVQPYTIKKDSVYISTKFVLSNTQTKPVEGSNTIIVVWPTGNGVYGGIGSHDTLRFKYAGITPLTQPIIAIKLYPNPSGELVHFSISDQRIRIKDMVISDMEGKVVDGWTLENDILDIRNLHGGIFILNIHLSDGSRQLYRLLKE